MERSPHALCEKCPKYVVFSGPYFPVFGLNMGKYRPKKLRIWTFFAQCWYIEAYAH